MTVNTKQEMISALDMLAEHSKRGNVKRVVADGPGAGYQIGSPDKGAALIVASGIEKWILKGEGLDGPTVAYHSLDTFDSPGDYYARLNEAVVFVLKCLETEARAAGAELPKPDPFEADRQAVRDQIRYYEGRRFVRLDPECVYSHGDGTQSESLWVLGYLDCVAPEMTLTDDLRHYEVRINGAQVGSHDCPAYPLPDGDLEAMDDYADYFEHLRDLVAAVLQINSVLEGNGTLHRTR